MEIQSGIFSIGALDEVEQIKLSGSYDTKVFENERNSNIGDENPPHPETGGFSSSIEAVFGKGNVLRRVNTECIDDLIKAFIHSTCEPCKDFSLSAHSISENQICKKMSPAKKKLFLYKGKIFVAYGRFVFGYDKYGREILRRRTNDVQSVCSKCELMKMVEDEDSDDSEECCEYNQENNEYSKNRHVEDEYSDNDSDYDSENEEGKSVITNNKIILNAPKQTAGTEDDYYSFMIYDQQTEVLDAFGLYCRI